MDLLQELYKMTKNVIAKGSDINDLQTIKDFIDLIPLSYLIDNGYASSDFTTLQNTIQSEIEIQTTINNNVEE